MKGGIFIVIYADVLFIINFFISFLLLELTARLTKRNGKTGRMVLSSFFGGIYSLVILVDLPFALSLFLKLFAAAAMLLIAFSFYRVKSFFASFFVFIFCNMLFLGIIIGIYYITKNNKIAVNNEIVYFDINARELLVCSFIAYLIACAVVRLYNRSLSKGEIYLLKIKNNGKSVSLYALSDTGNKLREPFSNSPVIVADKKILSSLYDESLLRVIPSKTVNSNGFLSAFKAQEVEIKTEKGSELLYGVFIALSDDLKNESYSAVINPEILSV